MQAHTLRSKCREYGAATANTEIIQSDFMVEGPMNFWELVMCTENPSYYVHGVYTRARDG